MSEINSDQARPSTLESVIGQRQAVEAVKVALAAARNDQSRFEHCLLVGPPGLGKTQISQIIGSEMNSGYREILAQSLASTNDVNALILASKDRGVILLDEVHEAAPDIQVYLFQVMDSRRLTLQSNRKTGGPSIEVKAPDVTLLLATTDEYGVLAPLRQRCRLTLRFSFYSGVELAEICQKRVVALGWQVNDHRIFEEIARRSRGTPRIALNLLQGAHRITRSRNSLILTTEDLETACTLEGIDIFGLGPLDRAYLRAICREPTNLNIIASRLGTHPRTVSQVIEPYLFRIGWVCKDSASRRYMSEMGYTLFADVQNV
jgi:Holliday junction DNA helicase RuvB